MVTSQVTADSSINERNVLVAVEQALALNTADFYCLVDGVDESLDDWNIRGQGCLETMLGLVNRHPRLYLLVAGREPSIRTLLKESTLNLEVTEDCTRSDINRFIAARLDDVPTIPSPETKQMVQTSLQEQSKVMFLWTTLILNQLTRCYTVEELSITLKQVPHDLDREYHRLFLQLMARTSGTRTRPSASMNRARILLMSILASPEPLTVEELRYSYAAHVHTGPRIEDSLIPVDGIIDACGDFLRITDGRYHLIHASLIDFLTRSSDEWRGEDCDIEYFRIDRSVAHKHMAAVCVGYLERLDLGYPLTDGGAPTLPLKYPFFSYATALLPYFLARVILHGDSAWGHSEIRRVGKTPQAWALIEYALATIQGIQQHSNGDHLHYWMELASVQFDWRPQALFAIYETELQRRLDCFGAEDSRYQVWQSISVLIVTFYPYWTGTSSSGPVSNSRQYANSHASRLLQKGTLPAALTRHLMRNIGFAGRKIPQALSTWTKDFRELAILNLKQMTSDLMTLSPDVLPVPVVLLMFQMAFRRYDWVSAEKLAATALKRTRGKNNFWECLSLLCLVIALLWNRTQNYEEAIQLARECIRKTAEADAQPHFLATKTMAYIMLTKLLVLEDRDEEARNALHNLESLIGIDRQKSGSRIAETLYRTRRGQALRMLPLGAVASDYNQKGKYMDAANLMDRALDIPGGVPSMEQLAWPTRFCFETQRAALYNAGDIQACMTCCRRLLEFLDGLPQDLTSESNTRCRRDTYMEMGWCFARLGSFGKAKEAFRQAANGLQLSNHSIHEDYTEALSSLAYGLLLTGNYEKCAMTVRKFLATDNVTEDETTLCPIPFERIQSLVDKMEGMGIIESDYRNLLRSASLLKTAEELKSRNASADAEWWIHKASYLEDPPVPAFRCKRVLLCLKAIDILLGDTNRTLTTVIYYGRLAGSLSAMGHQSAAGLVSADAASWCFSNLRVRFWVGMVFQADAALRDRKFEQTMLFLRSAWYVSRWDCLIDFRILIIFANHYVAGGEHIIRTEQVGDLTANILQPFLKQARAFLVQAREVSIELHRPENRIQADSKEDDSIAAEALQAREKELAELESRLVALEPGVSLAAASNEAPPLTVKLKRARSFSESASGQPLVSCRRRVLRPRSWELLCGVRD
jgi:tetratricopeptide (TPR) repeat protein